MRLYNFIFGDRRFRLVQPEENQGERLMMLPEQRRSEADADNAVPITVTVRYDGVAPLMLGANQGWELTPFRPSLLCLC